MSDDVLIAIVSTIGVVFTTIIAKVSIDLGKVKRDSAISREQTQNSHTEVNLRDNIDSNHIEMKEMLSLLREDIKGLKTSDTNQWTAIERLRNNRR